MDIFITPSPCERPGTTTLGKDPVEALCLVGASVVKVLVSSCLRKNPELAETEKTHQVFEAYPKSIKHKKD